MSELQKDLQQLRKCYKLLKLRRILKILLIGFLVGRNSDKKIAEFILKISTRIADEVAEISRILNGIVESETYLVYTDKEKVVSKIKTVEAEIDCCTKNNVLDADFVVELGNTLGDYLQFVLNYNKEFVDLRKVAYSHLWSKGPILLDDEQQTAIVTDDKHNLVVAAAGSGKTEVLITRIAYLIERRPDGVQPNRILAIAYQRKAMEEISQRLHARYRISEVNVRTFHKLGKDILEQSGAKIARTDIIDDNKKHGFIKKHFEQEIAANPAFYQLFLHYAKTVHDKEEELTRVDKEAAVAYAQGCGYFSLDNTQVKSKAEKEIMDSLLTNKLNSRPILVDYEPDVSGFRPDFYLPQYALFIEHWALNKKGEVPKWFSQSTEEYKGL